MLIGGTPAQAEVIDSGECGAGVTWTLTSNGTLTISGYGAMGKRWETFTDDGYSVDNYQIWGAQREKVREIVIQKGITHIGDYAFEDFSSLTKITIPDSVTEIEDGAFRGCTRLTTVSIPDSVTVMEDDVFEDCAQAGMDIYCEWKTQPRSWDPEWISNCNATVHWGASAPGQAFSSPFFWLLALVPVGVVTYIVVAQKKKSSRPRPRTSVPPYYPPPF